MSVDVALIAGLGDTDVLDAFFGEFMLPAPDGGYPASKVRTVAPPDWSQVAHQEIAKCVALSARPYGQWRSLI